MPRVGVAEGPRALAPAWARELGSHVVAARTAASGRTAYALSDGRLGALETATGAAAWQVDAHGHGINDLAVSPDGRLVATAGQDGRALVHTIDGARAGAVAATNAWVERVAFDPSGRVLAVASGKVVRLWGVDGSPLLETEPGESTITDLAFSASGDRLATCCYGGVRLWPVRGGAGARHLPFKGSLVSLAWSPDGAVVACGSQDCSVHFWRLKSGRDSEMSGYPGKPRALAWTRDSEFLATSGAEAVCVWRFSGKGPEGSRPLLLEGHAAVVTALATSAGGLLASGSRAGEVLVWRPGKGRKPLASATLDGEITSLAWTRDGLVGASAGGGLARWQVD
jgi:WD40 repeat protein